MFSVELVTLFQENDCFQMVGLRKHVDWLEHLYTKTVSGQIIEISAKCCRIAGNVDYFIFCQPGDEGYQLGHAPPGRIADDGVKGFPLMNQGPATGRNIIFFKRYCRYFIVFAVEFGASDR